MTNNELDRKTLEKFGEMVEFEKQCQTSDRSVNKTITLYDFMPYVNHRAPSLILLIDDQTL
jgi:hypothetical protein